jgi:hypothetical protein
LTPVSGGISTRLCNFVQRVTRVEHSTRGHFGSNSDDLSLQPRVLFSNLQADTLGSEANYLFVEHLGWI